MKIKARINVISRFNSMNVGCDVLTFNALRDGEEVDVKDEEIAQKLISRGICVKVNKKTKKSKEKR